MQIKNDLSKLNIFKSYLELTLLKNPVSCRCVGEGEEKGEQWGGGVKEERRRREKLLSLTT